MTQVQAASRRPLKIALLAPLVTPISQPFLGGAQAFLHDLALGLAERGHAVTLYAATGSRIDSPVNLIEVPVAPGEFRAGTFETESEVALPDAAFLAQGQRFLQTFLQLNATQPAFDLAHAHAFDWPVFALGALSSVPTVHTVHLPSVDPAINALLETVYRQSGRSRAVTVSQACAVTYGSQFAFDRVIYNGIETASIPFGPAGEGYLLFAGRMAPEKGPDLAIEVARRAGKRLIMAGGIYDQVFYEREVAPRLEKDAIEYRGQLQRAELFDLMRRADGVLFTSRWEEPFGLVLAESLAAGTPVVSWRRGAAPEIIREGRTGFMLPFGDIEGAARAVHRLPELNRAECRQSIVERFSLAKTVASYEDYYYEVLGI